MTDTRYWILLYWGWTGRFFSRFPATGTDAMVWTEARRLMQAYLSDRMICRVEVVPR